MAGCGITKLAYKVNRRTVGIIPRPIAQKLN